MNNIPIDLNFHFYSPIYWGTNTVRSKRHASWLFNARQ